MSFLLKRKFSLYAITGQRSADERQCSFSRHMTPLRDKLPPFSPRMQMRHASPRLSMKQRLNCDAATADKSQTCRWFLERDTDGSFTFGVGEGSTAVAQRLCLSHICFSSVQLL